MFGNCLRASGTVSSAIPQTDLSAVFDAIDGLSRSFDVYLEGIFEIIVTLIGNRLVGLTELSRTEVNITANVYGDWRFCSVCSA